MDRGMGRGRAAEERQRTGYGGGEREGWEGEELQKRGRERLLGCTCHHTLNVRDKHESF